MLDLTKPLRLKRNGYCVKFIGMDPDKAGIVVIKYVSAPYNYGAAYEQELENIPEPKVATALVAVYKKDNGDIYISNGYEGSHVPKAKITYTEGAENPWQIEEV